MKEEIVHRTISFYIKCQGYIVAEDHNYDGIYINIIIDLESSEWVLDSESLIESLGSMDSKLGRITQPQLNI